MRDVQHGDWLYQLPDGRYVLTGVHLNPATVARHYGYADAYGVKIIGYNWQGQWEIYRGELRDASIALALAIAEVYDGPEHAG